MTGRETTWLEVEKRSVGSTANSGLVPLFPDRHRRPAYRNIDSHVRYPVRQWLCTKFKVPGQGRTQYLTPTCTRSCDSISSNGPSHNVS